MATPIQISKHSLEYVMVAVSATDAAVAFDPTGLTVQMATSVDASDPGSWVTASWETVGSTRFARVLVGPGSSIGQLAVGSHYVWVRIVDGSEIPVLRAGQVTVF